MIPFRRSMTEDELLGGLTEALTLAGWRWWHLRRSDGVTMGSDGIPDLVAVHPDRDVVLFWELKGERTPITPDQLAWLIGARDRRVDARVIRPADYDQSLDVIFGRMASRLPWTQERTIARVDPIPIFGLQTLEGTISPDPRDAWPVDHERGE